MLNPRNYKLVQHKYNIRTFKENVDDTCWSADESWAVTPGVPDLEIKQWLKSWLPHKTLDQRFFNAENFGNSSTIGNPKWKLCMWLSIKWIVNNVFTPFLSDLT